MKSILNCAKGFGASIVCVLIAVSFCSNHAVAQSSSCVVDIATVFKNYTSFNQELEKLKQEAQHYKTQLQTQATELQKMAEELKTLEVNSDAYRQLENRIAQMNASLEVNRRNKTREFVQREATLHFQTYVTATQIISQLCDERGISLVLQYSSIPMSVDNPETVMQRVNSDIVFHSSRKDITNDVIARMNQGVNENRVGNLPSNNR